MILFIKKHTFGQFLLRLLQITIHSNHISFLPQWRVPHASSTPFSLANNVVFLCHFKCFHHQPERSHTRLTALRFDIVRGGAGRGGVEWSGVEWGRGSIREGRGDAEEERRARPVRHSTHNKAVGAPASSSTSHLLEAVGTRTDDDLLSLSAAKTRF